MHSYEFDTNGLVDTKDEKVVNSESSRREGRKALKLVEILIDKIIKRLEENSFEPKVQDALKAIQLRQKLVKTSEAEEMFIQALDDISQSEQLRIHNLENQTENPQAQILRTIMRLRYEVKNGVLPVKTITDAHNQGKSEECRLTYQRVGRLLSTMGFQKAKAGNNSAIFWNYKQIDQMIETFSPTPRRREDRQISSPHGGEGTLYSPSLDETVS
jgi:phenylalanyl-tRNA synthetase alpha subunit